MSGEYMVLITTLSDYCTQFSEKYNYVPTDLFYYKYIVNGLSQISKLDEKFPDIVDTDQYNFLIKKQAEVAYLRLMNI